MTFTTAVLEKIINADAVITMSWDYNLNYGNNLKLFNSWCRR